MKEVASRSKKPLFISLGSNINTLENVNSALNYLEEEFGKIKISNFYQSPAILGSSNNDNQADYLNAAILAESNLESEFIKFDILRKIEKKLNRIRTVDKFASRTIDLDIALYGSIVKNTENIIIPDPDIMTHTHVIYPLCDLDPDFIHPVRKLTLRAIKSTMNNSNVILLGYDELD
ncbi:MAG: 2-amino-4-hydroxy-6-hydroxymethyldihydropteridine diphosphokinase [Candidatus Heimdallarchaeota archaeon]|nr:2-amino-4-hydroxy-6-hydroxymethyldihydropteridine diphosphokinase [Candidatus Heimdallarchaeota archaeon]